MLIPMFTVASRSYRKCYALATMYTVLIIGSVGFYGLLTSDLCSSYNLMTFDWSAQINAHVVIGVILLSKIPTYPLMFWLPEAHVEVS